MIRIIYNTHKSTLDFLSKDVEGREILLNRDIAAMPSEKIRYTATHGS